MCNKRHVFNFLGSVSAGYSTAEPTVMLWVILCIFILNRTMVIGSYVFVRLCYRVIFIFVELQHILSALGEERAGVPYFSPDTVHVGSIVVHVYLKTHQCSWL